MAASWRALLSSFTGPNWLAVAGGNNAFLRKTGPRSSVAPLRFGAEGKNGCEKKDD